MATAVKFWQFQQAKPFTEERQGRRLYGYSYTRSPLIAYLRPRFRGPGELGHSNMCAEWWDTEPDGSQLIRKPEPFIQWAQRVFRWVRRSTPQWHEYKTYRLTDKVAAEVANGLQLVP